MNTKDTLMIATSVAAVGAFAVLTLTSTDETTREGSGSPAEGFTAGELPEAGCHFTQGEVATYSWRARDEATVDVAALGLTPSDVAPSSNTLETSFALTTRVLEAGDGSSLLLARMADVSSTAVLDPARLEAPVLLEVSSSCQVVGFAYRATTPRGYARAQQGYIHDLVWDTSSRSLRSSNATGEFDATLETSVEDATLVTRRVIEAYEVWPHARLVALTLGSSTLEVRHDRAGWFERATLRETLTGEHVSLTRTARVERVQATPEALSGVPVESAMYVWEDLLPQDIASPRPDPTLASRRERVEAQRGVPVEVALEAHVAFTHEDGSIHASWQPLRDWLEANPEGTSEVAAAIRDGSLDDRDQMTAYLALGGAQTAQAKDALVRVMDEADAPVVQRSRAILALIARPDTGAPLAEKLSLYSAPLASGSPKAERAFARQSILALGAMAGQKPDDAEVEEVAQRTVRRALSGLEDPLDRRPVYGAIANLGDPVHLSLVADIPGHPDRRMRKAAARVFRRMIPRDSDAFVEAWLRRETSLQVKRELYDTLERQTYDAGSDPGDGVLRLALDDLARRPGIATRKSLILLLSRALERRPDDPLRIRPEMARAAAFELAQNSGLFIRAADQLDPALLTELTRAHTEGVPSKDLADSLTTTPIVPNHRSLP